MDFIGFTYNGYHSIRDLNIYRTSDGSRYNENLTATMTDKTADVPGGDGQYYFGTQFKNRTFNVSYAFDSLSESGLTQLKEVFRGDGVHDLIFDETPYKVWSAKVTGTASIKHLCFEENGERVYKGEGSITFTCYYPFAHTPIINNNYEEASEVPTNKPIPFGAVIRKGGKLRFDGPSINIYYCERQGENWGEEIGKTGISSEQIINNASDIFITYISVQSPSTSSIIIPPVDGITSSCTLKYTTHGCFEHQDYLRDGRDINSYSIHYYPNKKEWTIASNLLGMPYNNLKQKKGAHNLGQIPAPFELKATSITFTFAEGETQKEQTLKVGDCEVVITINKAGTYKNFVWNSKTGIIKAEDTLDNVVYFPYTGDSIGTIPLNTDGITLDYPENMILDYQYWYY